MEHGITNTMEVPFDTTQPRSDVVMFCAETGNECKHCTLERSVVESQGRMVAVELVNCKKGLRPKYKYGGGMYCERHRPR